jgi:hypothetical protein
MRPLESLGPDAQELLDVLADQAVQRRLLGTSRSMDPRADLPDGRQQSGVVASEVAEELEDLRSAGVGVRV